jgi:hypothetical protein
MFVYKIIIQNAADHEVIEIAIFVWKEDNLFLAYMYTYDYSFNGKRTSHFLDPLFRGYFKLRNIAALPVSVMSSLSPAPPPPPQHPAHPH